MISSANNDLAIVLDVGTTNVRVVVIDDKQAIVFTKQEAVTTTSPQADWREQDPNAILAICQGLIAAALEAELGITSATPLGITNQRESVLAWDSATGHALTPLILWSDKRTKDYCEQLKAAGHEPMIRQKTGLFLTPYSSASKLHWLLQQPAVQASQHVALGTLDSWLVFKLTGQHLTDYTNACRTMLYNIQSKQWDSELLELFAIPAQYLAKVIESKADFGMWHVDDTTNLAISAVVGDQQASMYAAGTGAGTTKVTYGTGIFPMRVLGDDFSLQEGYITTLAIGPGAQPVYALEGKVENAAPRVSAVYGIDKPAFDKLMLTLAHEAAPVIAGLIDQPGTTVYVDGGISQNNDILAEQARFNHIQPQRLASHNGSALGVAKLIFATNEG